MTDSKYLVCFGCGALWFSVLAARAGEVWSRGFRLQFGVESIQYTWVVVKIKVPFWVP